MKAQSKIELLKEENVEEFAEVIAHSYPRPTEDSTEKRADFMKKTLKADNNIKYYAAFRKNKIVGGMKFFDFKMNIRNNMIPTVGLGLVGVNPINRRQGVGRDLMEFYIKENYSLGYNMLILYPYSLSFYRKMGFGYGTKHRMYKLHPTSFPAGKTGHLSFLKATDEKVLYDCYDNYAAHTNGMLNNKAILAEDILDDFTVKVVGYKKDGKIEGYLIYEIRREKPEYTYDCFMHVLELVYNRKEALSELLSYINAQKDQVERVHLRTQDEYLFFLLDEPLNGEKENFDTEQLESYTSALSMMYRVINVPGLFKDYKDHQFGKETFTLKLTLRDSFFDENNKSTMITFNDGFPKVIEDSSEYDVEVSMDISEFSSLFVGAVPFEKLLEYGLAEISDPDYVDKVSNTLNYY